METKDKTRDIWDMRDYLNRTSGYVPYKPLYYGEVNTKE